MNRKNQEQPYRNQGTQPQQPRGNRQGQSWGGSHQDHDQYYEGMQMGSRPKNSPWSADDFALDNTRSSQSYGDTDYDLDGSTYGGQGQSPRGMDRNFSGRLGASEYGSSYDEWETNDRNRQPSRYSSLDDDRFSASDRGTERWSERGARFGSDRNLDRSGSSSERFGYPANMNAWSGSDRSYNSGRMGQTPFSTQDYDSSSPHSYRAAGSSSFGERSLDRSDWGSSHPQATSFHGRGPKGYKRSDDRIKEDVCETLARDPRIDASDIEVNVDNAMVTLSGTVESREIKRAAEMVIENLSGVADVKNDIKVRKYGEAGNDMQATVGASRLNSGSTLSKPTPNKGTSHI